MSRENFVRLLLLLGCCAVPALAADTWIVRDNGVGPVKIGMTMAQLSSALHEKLSEEASGTEGRCYAKSRGHDHVAFMIIAGRVARIDVDAPGVFTFAGLQVGDSEAHARKVYGPKLKVSAHQYVDTGHYLTVKSDDPRYGVRFETDNGKITMYYAGNYDAIQYVEGCE